MEGAYDGGHDEEAPHGEEQRRKKSRVRRAMYVDEHGQVRGERVRKALMPLRLTVSVEC